MIDVLKTLEIEGEQITLFGKIDDEKHTVVFNYHVTNKASMDLRESIIRYPKIDMPIHDMEAQQYSIYGCKFFKSQLSFSKEGVVTIYGTFDRLVKEDELSRKYDTVIFSFRGIEKIFSLENFETQCDFDSGKVIFSKDKDNVLKYTVNDDIECFIESQFSGIVETSDLYELDVKQNKVIRLKCTAQKNIDKLLELVNKTKKYFEFVLKQEILLVDIHFCNSETRYRSSKLIYDPILTSKTFVKDIKDKAYPESIDVLVSGLDGWLKNYDTYYDVITIWQKSIYNTNVSQEDLYIWRCQAFELLCTINKEIYDNAYSLRNPKQPYPNLNNFLTATNNLYNFFKGLDVKYFVDIKDVRDKLTHNNPEKTITDIQKENSFRLIEFFLIKTLCKTMSIKGVHPTGFFLKS